jgi:hypothetical protein
MAPLLPLESPSQNNPESIMTSYLIYRTDRQFLEVKDADEARLQANQAEAKGASDEQAEAELAVTGERNPLAEVAQAQKELDELWTTIKLQGKPTEAQVEASRAICDRYGGGTKSP